MSRVILEKEEKFFLNLENEIKRLEREKLQIIAEISKESAELSKIIEKQIDADKKGKELVENAVREAEKIISQAKVRETKAIEKESSVENASVIQRKLEEEARTSIKSNEDLKRNLQTERQEVMEIKNKLQKIVELVKKSME